MEIYLLEYYKEIEYEDFAIEEYSLIAIYPSEHAAKVSKKKVCISWGIDKQFLYVSATKIGKLQWEGGFVTV